MRKKLVPAVGLTLAVALTAAACGSSSDSSGSASGSGNSAKVKLSLVAYSTPQAAYTDIIQAFQQTPEGKNITFTTSYGASGDQSRAVANGLRADVVAFSLESDVTRLVKANLVAKDWNANQHKGMVTDSVVVIGTRKGNPKKISTWDDLVKPGVEVISPNPFTSGGARWNVMAAYGAASNVGQNKAAGTEYLSKLFRNIAVQDDSARKSLQTFTNGKGDAMIAYENDMIFAQQKQQSVDYTVPDSTILIENPAAVTSDSAHPKEAQAFLNFLYTPTAQAIYAKNGYRPVVQGVSNISFPTPAKQFTIAQLGGWPAVTTEFFDATKGIVTKIEQSNGVSTSK
jgi:sulfate transport system substrate-binding protein